MAAKYMLEVFEPGSTEMVAYDAESDIPFVAVSAGDLLHAVDAPGASQRALVRVVTVEHIVWKSPDGLRQKLCVFTEQVENTAELRLRRA